MNLSQTSLLVILGAILLGGCGTESTSSLNGDLRVAEPILEYSEALRRKQSVRNPSYWLAIDLTNDSEFNGKVEVSFEYKPTSWPLTIDFSGGDVMSLGVNGRPHPVDYNGNFISLDSANLNAGQNLVSVEFRQDYSRDGAGLYRFVDPEDQRVYLYTDFEPYAANRMFPHFDQPDLKAGFSLDVLAPDSWQVVSTMRESAKETIGNNQRWSFPRTEQMSSYVFSLHAGPYTQWEDAKFRYPLRLFARQSQAQYVKPEMWFNYTRNGFDFFEPWFGYSYPFKKYDQLLVPDFNAGAMENIAAVTFAESFLTRSDYTRAERENVANVIFHEMAHMWFGDIATMAWWDGLWLNESFASVMAHFALASEPEFADAWHSFFLGYKQWAYSTDELVTTHPIQLPVPDTPTAEVIFDGITYGKGSSVLKQLSFYVGEDNFRQAIRDYIRINAFSNTELDDFTTAVATASNIDLNRWIQDWLYQAGFNNLETQLSCKAGKIESLQLKQTAKAGYPTIREHAILLALFNVNDGYLQLSQTMPVNVADVLTAVPAAVGSDCPALVYPNYEDWGFTRVSLDSASLETVSRHINDLREPLQRSMLWQDLWAMVQAANLPLDQFLDIAYGNIDQETEELVLSGILRSIRLGLSYFDLLGDQRLARKQYGDKFEALAWNEIGNSEGDIQRLWFDYYVAIASSSAQEKLEQILARQTVPLGLVVDQDLRWNILVALGRYGAKNSADLLAQEQQLDASAEGEKRALQAEVMSAGAKEKSEWLNKALQQDPDFRLVHRRTIMRALFPSNQRKMMAEHTSSILSALPKLESQHDILFFRHIARHLIPSLCTQDNVNALTAVIEGPGSFNPALSKALLVARQMDQRCLAIGARLK